MIYLCFTLAICFDMLWNLPTSAQFFLSLCSILSLTGIFIADELKNHLSLEKKLIYSCMIISMIIYELCKQNEYVYSLLALCSANFSDFIGRVIQNSISMSITYSGIDLVIMFFTLGMIQFLIFYPKKRRIGLFYLAACIATWGIYLALWACIAQNSLVLRLNLIEPVTGALDYRILLFAMLAGVFKFFESRYFKQEEFRIKGDANLLFGDKKIVSLINIVLIFALIGIYPTFKMIYSISGKKYPIESEIYSKMSQREALNILFWDTGIDFELPVHGRYGLDNVGMFGALIRYLESSGNHCFIEKEIEVQRLAQADVLCIINPMRELNYEQISEIYKFVEHGKTVVLAGDHTGDEEIRKPINSILERVDVSLNFDSAIPFKPLWGGKYEKKGKMTEKIDHSQVQIVVGASLDISAGAKPIISVKEGYSDRGNILNKEDGYLGDMRFFAGERIGDLVLAAQVNYGKGKFLVFGDTSLFQNTVIPYSHAFVDAIFHQESKDVRIAMGKEADGSDLCVINSAHLEGIYRDKSKDGIDGFLANLLRADFLPIVNFSSPLFELCENAKDVKLIVLIEPALPFSDLELNFLEDFIKKGGNLLVCADYKSPRASKNLVEHFGFSFEKIPIGRIAPDQNPNMAFWEACPIFYREEGEKQSASKIKTLMSIWDYPVIAEKKIGDGRFYLIADAGFLKNKNLEDIREYREGNIVFIKNLLEEIKKGG